ncbi:hypothetical protein [Deinococcus apachensis]|uniref:hypothetical protein n=1 Tax=Deinococcus apachensis TaxID=309886 RepID=UPI00036E3C2A|nr:hypothetical protein [Deinococcus apachensis]
MNDHELDTLFAQARLETPADAGAAERFLAWHRSEAAPDVPLRPHSRSVRWPLLLGCAALLTGAFVLRPAPTLPASAAYDAYQAALGDGW